MTHRTAFKAACLRYATANQIPVPTGFTLKDAYGAPARELTIRIQKRAKLYKAPTGDMTPKTVLTVGKYLPGSTIGERAVWAMRIVEGPLEVHGNNKGPYVQEIQKLGSELAPAAWPWCAASVSWALRSAGWSSWAAFVKHESEAWVPAWSDAAQAGRYGMSVKSWRTATTGDIVCFKWDQPRYQHIGFVNARPNQVTGIASTIEGNTSSETEAGSQDDGAGLWRRTRTVTPPQLVIRVR